MIQPVRTTSLEEKSRSATSHAESLKEKTIKEMAGNRLFPSAKTYIARTGVSSRDGSPTNTIKYL